MIEGGNAAYYQPGTDTIHVPTIDRFDQAASYYATQAHETVHATGHPSRRARTFGQRFGDRASAAEELVAELGRSHVVRPGRGVEHHPHRPCRLPRPLA
jgi:antirestriction protein ArdC